MVSRCAWMLVVLLGFQTGIKAQSLSERLDAVMKRYYTAGQPGAVLWVEKGDDFGFQKGYGLAQLETKAAIDGQTRFRMASVSKQFTAMCIFLLAEEGKLSLDAPLNTFFTNLPKAAQPITVAQLLQHTSGIWDYEALIADTQKTQVLDADVLTLIRQKNETYFTPGTRFKYSNTGYCLLALIVEQVSGVPYAKFVQQSIFAPLNMRQALVYEPDAKITHRAYGYHPANGTFRFADQSLTSATKGDGGVYLSAQAYGKWADAIMEKAGARQAYGLQLQKEAVAVKDDIVYSFGWFIGREADGSRCLFHSGESTGFHNIVYINPSKDLSIALFNNRDDKTIAKAFDEIATILEIQPLQGNKPVSLFNWLNQVYME